MIIQIKDKLRDNEHEIRQLLKDLKCTKIHNDKDGLRFGRDVNSSGTGNFINIHTLGYVSFSNNKSGDILTLVSDIKDWKLGDTVLWLAKRYGITHYSQTRDIKLPFGGFFKKYRTVQEMDITPPLVYDESELDKFEQCVSLQWIKDGIGGLTQMEFGVGYHRDIYGNDRITLPIRNEVGELCGVLGRLNRDTIENWEAKYLSLIPVNRSKILFGLDKNYRKILDTKVMYVVEAEKSVMKGYELDRGCVAVGKHAISPRQVKLIKSMFCERIVIAFDEDVSFDECLKEAEKLKMLNPFHKTQIQIVNMDNPYVEKGSKQSLFDYPDKIVDKILEEYLVTVF